MKSGWCLDRLIPFGNATAEALLAHLGDRERHPLANGADVGLANRGTQPSYDGVVRSLRRRAARGDVKDFRPHRLRHTAASGWLAAGGSESGLMAITGWTGADMLARYPAPARLRACRQ